MSVARSCWIILLCAGTSNILPVTTNESVEAVLHSSKQGIEGLLSPNVSGNTDTSFYNEDGEFPYPFGSSVASSNCLMTGACVWLARTYYVMTNDEEDGVNRVTIPLTEYDTDPCMGADGFFCRQFNRRKATYWIFHLFYADERDWGQNLTIAGSEQSVYLQYTGPDGSATLQMTCNNKTKGDPVVQVYADNELYLEHICMCGKQAPPICSSTFSQPDPARDFRNKINGPDIETCSDARGENLNRALYISLGVIGFVWLMDIILGFQACGGKRRRSFLQICCCGWMDTLSSPSVMYHPTDFTSAVIIGCTFGTSCPFLYNIIIVNNFTTQDIPDAMSVTLLMVLVLPPLLCIDPRLPMMTWPLGVGFAGYMSYMEAAYGLCIMRSSTEYATVVAFLPVFFWAILTIMFLFYLGNRVRVSFRRTSVSMVVDNVSPILRAAREHGATRYVTNLLNNGNGHNNPLRVTSYISSNRRLIAASTVCVALLTIIVSQMCEQGVLLGFLAEAWFSSGMCCEGKSCFLPDQEQAATLWVWGVDVSFIDRGVAAMEWRSSCKDATIARYIVTYGMLASCVLAACVAVISMFITMRSHARAVRKVHLGDPMNAHERLKHSTSSLTSAAEISGIQIILILVGWAINFLFFVSLIAIATFLTFSIPGREKIVSFVWTDEDAPGVFSLYLINTAAVWIVIRFFIQASYNTVAIHNLALTSWWDTVQFFLSTLNGLVSVLLRIGMSLLLNLLLATRLDASTVPAGWESWDMCAQSFKEEIQVSAFYSNQIMLAFVSVLYVDNIEEGDEDGHDTQPLVPIHGRKKLSRAVKRWQLAYTLVRNEKHNLAHDRRQNNKEDKMSIRVVKPTPAIYESDDDELVGVNNNMSINAADGALIYEALPVDTNQVQEKDLVPVQQEGVNNEDKALDAIMQEIDEELQEESLRTDSLLAEEACDHIPEEPAHTPESDNQAPQQQEPEEMEPVYDDTNSITDEYN
eukprot:m.47025 g.47025  ORF g.47025 m.47025 type:complete len:980 (+) comp10441_c0_seq1:149-3088(+)